MPLARSSLLKWTVLLAVYVLMFWSFTGDYAPGMDSMTYGAVAKHILSTGDWTVLHYTEQAYANFYQHPPLAMWMMAITMKFLGTADWVLRFLPALMGAFCAIGVYLWGQRIRGEWFAFTATFILLTSTRFAKYSKGFMLDPFLVTFSLWSLYLTFVTAKKSVSFLPFIAGILVALAFLSKGLFAFAPFVLSIGILVQRPRSLVWYFLGAAIPIGAWFVFGHAAHYLERYYIEHVSGRVGHYTLREHFAPISNLLKVYWPWLPLFLFGAYRITKDFIARKSFSDLDRPDVTALFGSLFFLGGFVLVASFLEQYNTSFYPFAALVVAGGLPTFHLNTQKKIVMGLGGLLIVLIIAMIIAPQNFHGTEAEHPMRINLKAAREKCVSPEIHRVAISTGTAEIWYALAMGSWNTDWDARSVKATQSPDETGSQLLLASVSESIHADWKATAIESNGMRIYQSTKLPELCHL